MSRHSPSRMKRILDMLQLDCPLSESKTESVLNLIEDYANGRIGTIVHGYWITHESEDHVEPDGMCSNCGAYWVFSDTHYFDYCPHCGARMDEVRNEKIYRCGRI